MKYLEVTDTDTGKVQHITELDYCNQVGLCQFDLAYKGLLPSIFVRGITEAEYNVHRVLKNTEEDG